MNWTAKEYNALLAAPGSQRSWRPTRTGSVSRRPGAKRDRRGL